MISAEQLHTLEPHTRQAVQALLAQVQQHSTEIAFKQALIDKLTHEVALLRRMKFAASSERFASTLTPEQKSLLEETLDTDLAELEREIERAQAGDKAKDKTEKKTPKRTPLPPQLPRHDVLHEPADTICHSPGCGQQMQRLGQDVAERLDYQPGVFSVERHVRGKWACRCCERIVQAAVPAHVIDKGIPTAGLLAHLLVAKFLDHLPLYRQEAIFERAGHLIARSTLAQWVGECGAQLQPLVQALADELRRHSVLHADETPVSMLKPKHLRDGKTHKAYIWSYCTTSLNPTKAVVFEFCETRSGENVREFLKLQTPQAWQGTLVTDGFSGYTATTTQGVTSAQCMAHYPERCFILSTRPAVAAHGSHDTGVALRINPTRATHRGIRAHVVVVYRPHGHSLRQLTAHRTSADGSGHPAGVARRSQHQRHRRAALSAMDRALPPLLWGVGSR
jgi:transposase